MSNASHSPAASSSSAVCSSTNCFPNDERKTCYNKEGSHDHHHHHHHHHFKANSNYRGANSNHRPPYAAYDHPPLPLPLPPPPSSSNYMVPAAFPQGQYAMPPPPFLPLPFIWPPYQPPIAYPYGPFGFNPTYPQGQYFRGPSFVPPRHDIYAAAQQTYYCGLLDILRARLRKQIEYYFSSENLCTDHYLRKHMDDFGWVSITLIEEFRKVQQLMKEREMINDSLEYWDAMQHQVQQSTSNTQFISISLRPSYTVEVQGDKVRKRHDWKQWIKPTPPAYPTVKSGLLPSQPASN